MMNPKPGQEPGGGGESGGGPGNEFGDLEWFVNATETVVGTVSGAFGTVASWIGMAVAAAQQVVDGLSFLIPPPILFALQKLINLVTPDFRALLPAEQGLGNSVFRNTLPAYSRLAITDIAGLSDRPFVIPGTLLLGLASAVAPLAAPLSVSLIALAVAHPELCSGYLLNFGSHYATAGTYTPAQTGSKPVRPGQKLIHELTHVWQGHNNPIPGSYVLDSVFNQIKSGHAAYTYVPGNRWREYNAEQQAKIVEDWFVYQPYVLLAGLRRMAGGGGRRGTRVFEVFGADPNAANGQALQRYLTDNIWTGNPDA
jgi:hypothetical protein